MADESIASIIPLHQPKMAKTGAERSRAYRQRKRKKATAAVSPADDFPPSELLIPEGFSSTDSALAEPPVTPPPIVTLRDAARDETPSRRFSPILLRAAALILAGVGIVMNGSFARSLGSSDDAGGEAVIGLSFTAFDPSPTFGLVGHRPIFLLSRAFDFAGRGAS